jgi:hypothetical protein
MSDFLHPTERKEKFLTCGYKAANLKVKRPLKSQYFFYSKMKKCYLAFLNVDNFPVVIVLTDGMWPLVI